jgi:hypothetical protein
LTEARLEDAGSGLAPVTEGWFVVNVRDAEWFSSETRGAACWFANEYGDSPVEFPQFGINVTVLEPGQSGVYHAESNQESFLVLGGECRLLVEGDHFGDEGSVLVSRTSTATLRWNSRSLAQAAGPIPSHPWSISTSSTRTSSRQSRATPALR